MITLRTLGLVGLAAVLGCGGAALDRTRFANQPAVTAVNDRRPVARPDKRTDTEMLYFFDALVYRKITRATELHPPRRAANVNALDEVPDSSWFTNRLGVRELSVDEIRRGPNSAHDPRDHKPWIIKSTKEGGAAVGFIVEDQAGETFLLKFDYEGQVEAETGAHIIVHRILWALGYNVPEDWLVEVDRDELVLAEDAVINDVFGNERRLEEADVDRMLTRAVTGDGTDMRALMSRFVPGEPLGGFPDEGVRGDDPNDLIPHEHRRELRGLHPVFAWLKHTDVKEANTLDTWIEDPARPGRHYVVHYLIDFGKALGVMGGKNRMRADGYAYFLDFRDVFSSLVGLGLRTRPQDRIEPPPEEPVGLGLYEIEGYHPGAYKPNAPYIPLETADRFDKFWGAKLLIRLTPEHLRAVVEEARYSDPRTSEYLARALIARQRETARYWFRRVNPLDELAARGDDRFELCFTDLTIAHRLEEVASRTRYRVSRYDHGGEQLAGEQLVGASADGRVCVRDLEIAAGEAGYTIVAIDTERPGVEHRPLLVHVARSPDGDLRVIGLRRQ